MSDDQAHWKEQVGKKRDCVTADNEKFNIVFNFELLDDTYVMSRRVVQQDFTPRIRVLSMPLSP